MTLFIVLTLEYTCFIHGVCISVDPEDTSDQYLGKDVDVTIIEVLEMIQLCLSIFYQRVGRLSMYG